MSRISEDELKIYEDERNFTKYENQKAKFNTKFVSDMEHNGEIIEVIGLLKGKDTYCDRYIVRFNDGTIDDNIMDTEIEFDFKKGDQMLYYTEDEIEEIIEEKEDLFFADDGINEVIIKLKDIPDFIVDVNSKETMTDLKFYRVNNRISSVPDIKTMGIFLDKISPELRKKIIDRLVALQTGQIETKVYKVIDEDLYNDVKIKLEKELMDKQKQNNKIDKEKQRKKKNREAR